MTVDPRSTAAFDALVADFHAHFTADPNQRVNLGVDRDLGELPDPSLAAAAERVTEARALLARLADIDSNQLDFDRRLDYELATLQLESAALRDSYTFNGKTRLAQSPKAGDDIGDPIFQLFINDPRPAADRLTDIASRISQVPDYLEAMLARLETPVARWVAMECEIVEELPSLFAVIQAWAGEVEWSEATQLASTISRAEAALSGYLERLRQLPTTTQLHLGEDIARQIVKLRGIDESLEELHQIASDFLREERVTIDALRTRLVGKYDLAADTSVTELQQFLTDKYAIAPGEDFAGTLDAYQSERDRVVEFVTDKQLFPIFPEQEFRILKTPGFMEPSIPAGAMMPPPAFRSGVKVSTVYLTLKDDRISDHTQLLVASMLIHEGIPGHHLQLATAAIHSSVVRRHMDAAEQAEGWATMLEDYMLDVGYMSELADEIRFCGKLDLSRIGARVAIDLFFMTGDRKYLEVGVDCDTEAADPFVAAASLLGAVTGFSSARVQGELNWYSQERGYPLSYLTGNRQVWQLKRDVAAAQEGKLSGLALDREFHRVFLDAGNMPVKYLRRVFAETGLLG